MPSSRRIGRRGICTAAATACAATGLALLVVAFVPQRSLPGPPPGPPPTVREPDRTATKAPASPAPALPPSKPVRITSADINLATAVEEVGTAEDGSIALPENADHAGWYTGSVTPGERGNTIIVGHVDSTTGPAAFYGLGALRTGDRLTLERRDGRDAHFTVTGMKVHAKDAFPSAHVYRPTLKPQLTLITCTDWDERTRDYRANLVLTARLTG